MPEIIFIKALIRLRTSSAIAFFNLNCKAVRPLPATRKKSSFFSIKVRSNYFRPCFYSLADPLDSRNPYGK